MDWQMTPANEDKTDNAYNLYCFLRAYIEQMRAVPTRKTVKEATGLTEWRLAIATRDLAQRGWLNVDDGWWKMRLTKPGGRARI